MPKYKIERWTADHTYFLADTSPPASWTPAGFPTPPPKYEFVSATNSALTFKSVYAAVSWWKENAIPSAAGDRTFVVGPYGALYRARDGVRCPKPYSSDRALDLWQPKTVLLYVVQGNYGHGWEDLTAEETWREASARLKEYRDNEPGPHRLIKRREKREP